MYYKVNHGSINFGANTIIEDINFEINDGEKIGIVGRNGSGKSSLIKAIIGELSFDDGYEDLSIDMSKDFTYGYVNQNITDNNDMLMIDYILDAYKDILSLKNQITKYENEMANSYDDTLLEKYHNCIDKFEVLGGNSYIKEYENALNKFGFTSQDKNKRLNEFSGGQLTKLALIKLLLSKPKLLILDEPTNHLDIDAIIWLENYLVNYKNSIILVSHDRMFIDKVCNIIYEIEYGNLKRYKGNYTYFVKKKEEDYNKQLKDYNEQQKEIKRLNAIVERFKYKPTKASMAMSKLKQIERMVLIDKPKKEDLKTFKFDFKPTLDSYRDVLKLKNVSVGYDTVLANLNFSLEKGDKLGVIGKNGTGKSTLLKSLVGELPLLGGKIIFGNNVSLGYFSQKLDNLNYDNTIYDEISETFTDLDMTDVRKLLGIFEFTGDEVYKKIKDLSGGEKVRVSLCKVLNYRPNFLILDEPTNHLDIISKNTIEKLLNNYEGTLIIVSHDRYLINNVCNKILSFDDNCELFNMKYEEYVSSRTTSEVEEVKIKEERTVPKKKYNYDINKEREKIEKKIAKLEEDNSLLNEELFKEDVYSDSVKLNEINSLIEKNNIKLQELYQEWESLM